MNREEAEALLIKYKQGTVTEQERALLETWYARFQDQVSHIPEGQLEADTAESWRLLAEQYGKELRLRKNHFSRWAASAAAAVAVIVFGLWFYHSRTEVLRGAQDDKSVAYTNDIAPGGNKATITIGDGEAIELSDKQTGVIIGSDLKYNDGTILSSRANGLSSRANAKDPSALGMTKGAGMTKGVEMTSLTTPRGGTYQVTLPDGTKVWLNAASKISFPNQFIGKERKILMIGEGYFEVAKNKQKPFIVESAGQRVTVLGTHFNISAYKGEAIKTTLLEGSVKVLSLSSGANAKDPDPSGAGMTNSIILKPNQQALLTANRPIIIKQVNTDETLAWKNGKFIFESEGIEHIMKVMARWYNVEVIYEGKIPADRFNANVSKFAHVSTLLHMLERTKAVHFKIEGRRIIVSR